MLRGRSFVWRIWEGEDGKGNVFRLANQLVSKNRDVVSASCVKDDDGKIVVEEDKLMEVWRAHYDEISNEEFAWDRNGLTKVNAVCGPCERISALEVWQLERWNMVMGIRRKNYFAQAYFENPEVFLGDNLFWLSSQFPNLCSFSSSYY